MEELLRQLINEGVSISINPQSIRGYVEVRLLRGGVVAQSKPMLLHQALLDAKDKFDIRVADRANA